jgi:flagellar hook-length control protein FliK
MLPTQAIKPDPSVAAAAGNNSNVAVNSSNSKDKDATSSSLEANFSAYFSMMVAAMPSLQTGAPVPIQAAPSSAPPARPVDDVKQTSQNSQSQNANQAAAEDQVNGAAQSTASVSAQAQAGAAQSSQQAGAAATGSQADSGQASAPNGEAKTAATATAAGSGGYAAPAPAKPTAPQDPAPQAGTAPAAAGSAAANAQDAMAQAYPGGKFQVQYDDGGATATSKAPLTEFVNQIQMDTTSGGDESGSLPASASLAPPAAALPAAAIDMAAALQSLQTPLAATTALLAPALPETGPASGIGALSGNVAAAQAVGAGALPGASGSVRVTPSTAAEATPTGEESLLSQVDGSIRFLVKNQDKSAEMQLHPESLGRVQISLKVEGTVVHAKVWASEASTVPILQDHRATLEASLKAQGLTLGSFDLQHGRKEQQAPLPAPSGSAPISSQTLAGAGQESPGSVSYAPARTSQIEYVA